MDFDALLPPLILLMLIAMPLAALLSLRWLRPRRSIRVVILSLVAVEVLLALLQTLAWRGDVPYALAYFLDADQEYTLPAVFSALQLTLLALVALGIGIFARGFRLELRVYFLFVVAAFLYLAADEYHMLHEEIGGTGNLWRVPYALTGLLFLVASVIIYRRYLRKHARSVAVFVAGVGVFGGSAAAFEPIIWTWIAGRMVHYQRYTIFEETLEMFGVTLALAGMLALSGTVIPTSRQRGTRLLTAVGGAAAVAWMLFYTWLLPALEWHFGAQPLDNTYDDGAFSLVGVWSPHAPVRPGDKFRVYFYWRANETVRRDYHLSVHALAQPDIESVAQADVLLAAEYPSRAWLPGVITRGMVTLQMPDSVPAPASYWLTARVWTGDWTAGWEATRGVDVDYADRQLITPDTMVVASLPVLTLTAPPEPDTGADYRFAPGFSLYGYALPQVARVGEPLDVRFWWSAERDIVSNMTQFIHLVDSDGEMVTGFDSPPFRGAFPTSDWRGGMQVVDAWPMTLPSDIPAGTYAVYSGMYAPETGERVPVSDNGAPIVNSAIRLGELTVTAAAE